MADLWGQVISKITAELKVQGFSRDEDREPCILVCRQTYAKRRAIHAWQLC